MPNYVYNMLEIDDAALAEKIFSYMKTEENDFDFNQIVPMPDDIYQGPLGQKEREEYGSKNWYDWSIENWGTKWNASSVSYGENTVYFDTAWAAVPNLILQLMDKFSVKNFSYYYAEEQVTEYCGYIKSKNGEITTYEAASGSKEAFDIFEFIMPESGFYWDEERQEAVYQADEETEW